MVRLVVVAVEEHQIARREKRIEHDLVGGGGAVEDEVRLVGVVDLGGRHLGGTGHAFVDEQVAHRDVGVAEVGAEDVFAEEVGELTACRMTAEEGAALVTRTVEVHVAVADVGLHLAEEGRKNLILVLLGGGVDQATVEANVVGLGVDDGDDLAEELGRELGAVVEQNDGNAERRRLDAFELARERLVITTAETLVRSALLRSTTTRLDLKACSVPGVAAMLYLRMWDSVRAERALSGGRTPGRDGP